MIIKLMKSYKCIYHAKHVIYLPINIFPSYQFEENRKDICLSFISRNYRKLLLANYY